MKMVKKFYILMAVAGICMLIAACNSTDLKDSGSVENGRNDTVNALNTISVKSENNMELSVIASNGESFFYVLSEALDYSNYDQRAQIIRVDMDGSSEVIHEEKDASGFYISELKATDRYLVWERMDEDKLVINRMNLGSGEIDSIYEYDDPNIPVLISVCGDNKIAWYDMSTEDTVIRICYLDTGNIDEINNVKVNTPYQRIETNDGIGAFLVADDSTTGEQKVAVYDFNELRRKAEIVINEELPLTRLCANESYITYMLADEEDIYSLHAYQYVTDISDTEVGKNLDLNPDGGMYIFSYRLIDNMVLINEKNSNDIISIDLESGEQKNITENKKNDHNYYLDGSCDGIYYAYNDVKEPEIIYIEV